MSGENIQKWLLDEGLDDLIISPENHIDCVYVSDAIKKYVESRSPIANNGVSFDSIVDKLTHLNGDHLMGLELNNIHIIANFITKLPTTAPRGGNMIDVVKKAVESGAVVIKPCTANCLNGIITDHEGAEVRDIVCPTCSGREYVITEGEVSGG